LVRVQPGEFRPLWPCGNRIAKPNEMCEICRFGDTVLSPVLSSRFAKPDNEGHECPVGYVTPVPVVPWDIRVGARFEGGGPTRALLEPRTSVPARLDGCFGQAGGPRLSP
jgi:hypothetical protein